MTACIGAEAAYTYGEEWLDEMLEYVEGNINFACDYIKENIPCVKAVRPQASFLLWVDFPPARALTARAYGPDAGQGASGAQ